MKSCFPRSVTPYRTFLDVFGISDFASKHACGWRRNTKSSRTSHIHAYAKLIVFFWDSFARPTMSHCRLSRRQSITFPLYQAWTQTGTLLYIFHPLPLHSLRYSTERVPLWTKECDDNIYIYGSGRMCFYFLYYTYICALTFAYMVYVWYRWVCVSCDTWQSHDSLVFQRGDSTYGESKTGYAVTLSASSPPYCLSVQAYADLPTPGSLCNPY